LLLNGTGRGIINNVAPLSAAQPSYAASGHALVAVSLIGTCEEDDAALDALIRSELQADFRIDASAWRLLRTARVRKALPDQRCGAMSDIPKRARLRDGLYLCGDHTDHRSINGALSSGRRAGEAILADIGIAAAD
jgi:hypothetical protein